jgi:hypothetical protein
MTDRPLLICDADEVLVQFTSTFEIYLAEQGYGFNFDSFALNGNIRRLDTGEAASPKQVSHFVDDFFADRVEACPAVAGAADALKELSKLADVMVLTNIPAAQQSRRAKALEAAGMPYPVYTNEGPKGPAVRSFAGTFRKVAFVDDMPPHHKSVAEHVSHVHRLHLISDTRLRGLIPKAPYAHARIDDWDEALPYLFNILS